MTLSYYQRIMKEAKMTFFLALEDNDGSHQFLEIKDATQTEAEQFLEDAYKYTNYRAIYLFDAYCPWCATTRLHVDCDHELQPADHLDFVHCRIDVDETKKGVQVER